MRSHKNIPGVILYAFGHSRGARSMLIIPNWYQKYTIKAGVKEKAIVPYRA